MGTISDKINYLNSTKTAIHDAIVAKGVEIPTGSTFRSYASKIADITSSGGSSGGSSSVVEWSQEYYDAVFQASLGKVDPVIVSAVDTITSADYSTGRAVAVVQIDNSDSEFAKLTVTFTGTCTINWGDGTTSTPTSGNAIEHLYSYSNVNLSSLAGSTSKFAVIDITCVGGTITRTVFNGTNTTTQKSKYIAINAAGNSLSTISVSQIYTLEYFKSSKNIISSMSDLFNNCYSLATIPSLDTSSCPNMDYMFSSCYSLTTIPLLNTSVCTNMSGMFSSCYSLTTIPLLDTSKCTTMGSMFTGCFSLTTIPLLDTSKCTYMKSMFNNCYSLTTIPLLNTSVCTNMSSMFYRCYSLTTIPLLNTSVCPNMDYMFSSCYSLTTIPLLDTSKCTTMGSMFTSCLSLTTIPLLDTSKCTYMSDMFNSCYSLTNVPALSTISCTDMSSMFSSCYSLTTNPIVFRKTSSVQNNKYSAAMLNQIYTNLPTVTGQTLSVGGNWGIATDNPSIATAKGWTISG